MHIGIVIGRIGGVDGVALETEKWMEILEKLGHKVFIIAGVIQKDFKNITLLPELDFHHALTVREQKAAFFQQDVWEDELVAHLKREATYLEKHILTWIVKNKIEFLISENASALPSHLAMGMAIKNILEETSIPCLTHDHDFYWERGKRYKTRYGQVQKIIENCFPVNLPNVQHAVINLYNKTELKKRLNIEASVVPNVMDFSKPYGQKDKYNKTLLQDLSLDKNDLLLFQITRIVRRKGIHTAIELVKKLDDSRVKLIITGGAIDDHNSEYYCELVDLTASLHLSKQVLFAGDFFAAHPRSGFAGKKIYSLSDAYAHSHACTYFSTYEGFGNAFVEAVLAKKPIFVNNYEPIYWPDIGSKGFKAVMIENGKLTSNKIKEMKDILYDPKKRREIAEYNFKLGKKYFSFEVLERHLKKLI